MKKSILSVIYFVAVLIPCHLFAGGFQLNVQGQKALSMGGTALANSADASAVFFNPGALGFIKHKYSLTGGVAIIIPNISVQTPATLNINQTSPVGTPIQFYAAAKITDKVALGLGVNNQFGSTSSFDKQWEGKYIVQKLALQTFMYQPTATYTFNNRIGIGAGFTYTTGSFEFEKAVPVATAQLDNGNVSLKGTGVGFGFNMGIQAILLKEDTTKRFTSLKAGFSYRSPIEIILQNGSAKFTDISIALRDKFPEETTFNSKLTLPGVISIGLQSNIRINNKIDVDVALDYNFTQWSSYDSLKIDFANPNSPDGRTPKKWKDSSTLRFGASLNYNKKYSLRLGTYYDETPIPDGYVSPELPDNTNIGFTAGIGAELTKNLSIDISWLVSDYTRAGLLIDGGFEANYRRNINTIGIGINYHFN